MEKKRYLILGLGAVLLLFCGLIYAWSLFRTPFQEVYPQWTLSQLSMTFTISMTFFCIGGFLSGRMLLKRNAAIIISLSAALVFVGFLGVSMLNPQNSQQSLLLLYGCYGILGGTGIGLSYNAILATVNRLFPDQPGLASGIMLLGFGMGGLVLGSIVTGLINSQGIFSSFRLLAVCMFLVLLAGAQIIGRTGKTESKVSIKTKSPEFIAAKDGLTTGEMLKSASFWIFIVWNVLTNSAGLMVVNSAASIAVAFGAPAIVGMVVSLCNGIGRVIIGHSFDKLGRERTMVLDCILTISSSCVLVTGAVTEHSVLIILGLILAGFFFSGAPTIAAAFVKQVYGEKYYSVNFSIANFSLIPAAMIGPTLSSRLISASGGSYLTTFIVIAVCGLLSISTLPLLKKKLK